jgi:hypothetical protein
MRGFECTTVDLEDLLAYLRMPIADYWELAVPSATPKEIPNAVV